MKEILKLSQQFWSLFTSKNRYIYIEALMAIYDEYLYNDYFLTKETCIQIIAEHFADRIVDISADKKRTGYCTTFVSPAHSVIQSGPFHSIPIIL